jgi:hypothetical protein
MRCKHYNAFETVVSASINNTAVRNPQQLCIDAASPSTYQRPFTVDEHNVMHRRHSRFIYVHSIAVSRPP